MQSPQSETYGGLEQVEVLFFHKEDYRGHTIHYGQAVDEEGINYYSMSSSSPFFCLSAPDIKQVRTKAESAIDFYKEYEERDWVK